MTDTTLELEPRAGFSLRQILAIDGITCLLMGLALILAADSLAAILALPATLMFYAGIILLPCAALMLAIARMPSPPAPLVWIVIAGNAAWVLASLVVALGVFDPNALGLAFVLLQAAVVTLLLVYELRALKSR